jgi:hypothetical protein
MAIFYVGGCALLLIMNASGIPATLQLIFQDAFTGQAMIGGFAGATMKEAIRYGVARGLFSNESGLGSAPIVAAAAQTKNPVRQALVSSTGTFWDTVVVCAMTGLVLASYLFANTFASALHDHHACCDHGGAGHDHGGGEQHHADEGIADHDHDDGADVLHAPHHCAVCEFFAQAPLTPPIAALVPNGELPPFEAIRAVLLVSTAPTRMHLPRGPPALS